MTDVDQTADLGSQIAALQRQVRILEKKVARSEQSRVALENAKDRFDVLYQKTIGELDEQKALVDEKNGKLESLSLKLSKYLAPQIYQSIFSSEQAVSLETKRKKLTVFFSDIKDFTQITEDLQAEDLADLLNEYFTEMSQIALEHGATIDKFIGDAMLMFFGDPKPKASRRTPRRVSRWRSRCSAGWRAGGDLARQGISTSIPDADRHQHGLLQRREFRQRSADGLHDHRRRGELGRPT